MQLRYEKNLSVLSEQESDSLADKSICVIGCGGLGGYIIEMAARLGVGHITVVDPDVFCESNLNRQLLSSEKNLGLLKVAAAKARIAEINSQVTVKAVAQLFDESNARQLLAGCSVAVDALDNVSGRLLLQQKCGEMDIPLVHGAVSGWYGQVTTVLPGDNSLDLLYSGAVNKSGSQPGTPAFAAAATASMQCAEIVKLLTGKGDVLHKKLLCIDMLRHVYNVTQF